jgi:hypothetical protein
VPPTKTDKLPSGSQWLHEIKHDGFRVLPARKARRSGEWNDDDYDVLADGAIVGRILKAAAVPVGQSWMWSLPSGNRTPIYGYEPTREAAMAAFAKSWRRE